MARRSKRQRTSAGSSIQQLPWAEVRNPYSPHEELSADHVEAIHQAALKLLDRVGMRISSDAARKYFSEAGADVDEVEQPTYGWRISNL